MRGSTCHTRMACVAQLDEGRSGADRTGGRPRIAQENARASLISTLRDSQRSASQLRRGVPFTSL